MAHGGDRVCGYARERQLKPEVAAMYDGMRESLKQGMEAMIEVCSRPQVPNDYGKQNSFYASLEGQVTNCEQYEDEMTQAIALSVIPEDIVALGSSPVD